MQKRIIAGIFVMLMLCVGIQSTPLNVSQVYAENQKTGDKVTKDGIYYRVEKSGNVTITGYDETKLKGKVVIPDTIENRKVIAVGAMAFMCCDTLTSITIPATVMSIQNSAFAMCENLKTVKISKGVRYIRNNAFLGCFSLQKITIPRSVRSIGNYAFEGCDQLEYVRLFRGLKTIGDGAFLGCTQLTKLYVPWTVTSMGEKCYGSEKHNWKGTSVKPSDVTLYGKKDSVAYTYSRKNGLDFIEGNYIIGKNYKVIFDQRGGRVSIHYKGVVNGQNYGKLPVPTKSGYVFQGWYTARTVGTKITKKKKVNLQKDQTLYARWTKAS